MTSGIGVVVDQKTLRERFNKEPMDVFLDLLRDAGEPITAKKAMDTLIEAGLPKPLVAKQWKSAQKYIIRYHRHVVRPSIRKYQWSEKHVAPDEALGQSPDVGSPVTIVRPGYSRRTGGQAEIIEKALVARE